jgi:hypothetical protein
MIKEGGRVGGMRIRIGKGHQRTRRKPAPRYYYSSFTISVKLKLFIHFSLLHVSAVNSRPSSDNSYIHSTNSVILPFPIGQCLHLREGRIVVYIIKCRFFRLGMYPFKCVKP